MAEEKQSYRRISGLGRKAYGYVSLWIASDHLLQVESITMTERYRRFYFRDIQAISIQQTSRNRWIGILSGIGICLFALLAIAVRDIGPQLGVVPAVLLLTVIIVNWWKGPTCKCYVQTAVGTERIESLKRLKVVRRLLDVLLPAIEAAQGKQPIGTL